MTAEGWYYFEDPRGAQWEQLLSKGASATNPNVISFGLEYYYGTLRARVGKPSSSQELAVVTAPVPVEFQKWTHVAITFEDATRQLALWINGKLAGTALSPEGIGYDGSPLRSGRNLVVLGRQQIWNRALSASEIAGRMLGRQPTQDSGLVLRWEFNESPDTLTVLDSSPFRNHGALLGTPDWRNFPQRLPTLGDASTEAVRVRVDDGRGGVAEQAFTLEVLAPILKSVSGVVYDDQNGNGIRDVPVDANRIANPDFSSNNAAWETDFVLRQPLSGWSWLGDSQATVASTSDVIPLSSPYIGHTNGNTGDRMLMINGDVRDRVAWRQSVAVVPGQQYAFGFWALRPSSYEAARLQVRVDGAPLGPVFTMNDVGLGAWKSFRELFVASGNHATMEIVSLGSLTPPAPGLSGAENALAIDDLSLVPADARQAIVSGTANPYLAGMPHGSTAFGSVAPQGSPPFVRVSPGELLRVRATGHVRSDGSINSRSPDGIIYNTTGTVTASVWNGISQFAGPNHGSLLGVFLNDDAPAGQSPPAMLDFRSAGNVAGGIDYTSLAPQLRQLFFLGDGYTATGIEQTVMVPDGATRLFLATSSANFWKDNAGAFEVQVLNVAPEPAQSQRAVYVDLNRNQRFDQHEPTATTDVQGRYVLYTHGSSASVGLVTAAGRLQTSPSVATQHVDLNGVTPQADFGSQSISPGQPPVFTSVPHTSTVAPGSYAYQAYAQSTDGLLITYALVAGPDGMSIDGDSGSTRWDPRPSQAGVHDVLIKAFDESGSFQIQRFQLAVVANTPPVITSTPPETAGIGQPFAYHVRCRTQNNPDGVMRLVSGPLGMTVDSSTGVLRFLPSTVGTFSFEVAVADGQGGSATQQASVTALPASTNQAPRWDDLPASLAVVNRIWAMRLRALDADRDPLTYSLVDGPPGLTVTPDGGVTWQPRDTGLFPLRVAVNDGRGGVTDLSHSIQVVSRAPAPSLTITSQPETFATVGFPYAYDVRGVDAALFELIAKPAGMSIDSEFGMIRWHPTKDALGVQPVRVRTADRFGNAVEQSFTIAVRSSTTVPTISSAPPTDAVVGRTYVYAVTVDNPSRSPLQFALPVASVGMTIDAATGVVTWTPNTNQAGPATVVIRVSDALGNFSTQSYAILVTAGAANSAPTIVSTPAVDAAVGAEYEYAMQANDPEGATLIYGIRTAPAGVSIHPATGVVSWTPSASDAGTVTLVLTASDPHGGIAVQAYSIDVRTANRAPAFRSQPVARVSQGGRYQYDAIAVDPDREPLYYELLAGPSGMTIDALGASVGKRSSTRLWGTAVCRSG